MKKITRIAAPLLAIVFAVSPFATLAGDQKEAKAKPYPLNTCIVSGEKLGDMGETFTFVYQGQEIKLCCKSCQKDFNKAPKKYLKKLAESKEKK